MKFRDYISHYERQNLWDTVLTRPAAESIGSVKGLDVSALRVKTGDIMIIMGRRLYEELKQWGPPA